MARVPLKRTTETARATGSTAGEGDHVAQVDVHAGLQGAALAVHHVCVKGLAAGGAKGEAIFVYWDDTAVAEYGEVLAEAELRDADLVEKVRAAVAVEGLGQGCEDGVVVLGVAAELGDSLCDQDVEPVEALGLVAVDTVVRLAEDGADGQRGRARAQDAGFLLLEGWVVAAALQVLARPTAGRR
ncbi:hypothetical protein RB595_000681 [Gaeumannomyces hyphopodioides]